MGLLMILIIKPPVRNPFFTFPADE